MRVLRTFWDCEADGRAIGSLLCEGDLSDFARKCDSFRMHRSDTGHGRHQGDKCLTISGELGATCLRANAELRDRKAQRTSLLSRNLVP